MKKTSSKRFLLSGMLLAYASLAFSQTPSLSERFDRQDRNRDGKITAEDLPRPDLFQRLDRNGDGIIERSEIETAPSSRNRLRSAGSGDLEVPDEPPHTPHLNLRYAEIEGVDPNLLSLDLYVPKDAKGAPVMMWRMAGPGKSATRAAPADLLAELLSRQGMDLREYQLPAHA